MTDGAGTTRLSRASLVDVALYLVQRHGLEALTMRRLADHIGVKPASLYWHVRDRGELVGLLGDALVAEARLPDPTPDWRHDALAACAALEHMAARRRDAARVLLEVPAVLEASGVQLRLRSVLEAAGLAPGEAHEVTTMMLLHVVARAAGAAGHPAVEPGRPMLLAIDTGSRGVTVRAGSGMSGLIRATHDATAAVPASIRGDRVVVRRVRRARQGELELNPAHPWRVQVQAPTWNTMLDLTGIDLRGLHIDSGAARVECVLPPPRGVVPIHVSSGVAGVRLRRAPGIPVVADISPGALRLRLDAFSVAASTANAHWESALGASDADHYHLEISGGVVRVALEEDPSIGREAAGDKRPAERADAIAALNVVLDGVATRLAR